MNEVFSTWTQNGACAQDVSFRFNNQGWQRATLGTSGKCCVLALIVANCLHLHFLHVLLESQIIEVGPMDSNGGWYFWNYIDTPLWFCDLMLGYAFQPALWIMPNHGQLSCHIRAHITTRQPFSQIFRLLAPCYVLFSTKLLSSPF